MKRIQFRKALALPFLLFFGAFVLAFHSASFPLYALRRCGWDVLVFLWIAAAAFGLGRTFLRRVASRNLRRVSLEEKAARNIGALSWFPAFEEAILSWAIGLGALAYLMLAINLLQLLRLWLILPLMLLLGAVGLHQFREWREEEVLPRMTYRSKRGRRLRWRMPALFRWGVYLCIGIPLVVSFLLALGPVSQSDAIRYHMAAPRVYLHHGGDVLIPDSAFTNFPFTIEMLFALGLALGSETAARLVHWFWFALLCGAVYCLARHVRSKNFGPLAVVPFVTTPFIPIFASWAFIEMGLSLYLFLTFSCLIRLLRCLRGSERSGEKEWPPDPSRRRRFVLYPMGWIILAGVFCGFSMGIKYTTGVSFFVALGIILWKSLRDRISRPPQGALPHPVRALLVFCLIAGFIASPWYLKNLIRFGNPLYPFLSSALPAPGWGEFNAEFYKLQSGQKGELNEFREMSPSGKAWDLTTLPYSLTVGRKILTPGEKIRGDLPYLLTCRPSRLVPWLEQEGIRGGLLPFLASGDRNLLAPYRIGFGGWEVGPLWLLLIPLYFTIRKAPFETKFLTGVAAVHFLVWSLTYRDNRFLIPIFAFLSLPAGYFLLALAQKYPHWRGPLRTFFLLLLLRNVAWTVKSAFTDYNPLPYLAGSGIDVTSLPPGENPSLQTGDELRMHYLTRARDTAGFIKPMMRLNEVRNPGEKVLLVGEYRPYHCDPPYLACDWFDTPPVFRLIHETPDAETVAQRLWDDGVRFVFINQGELDKYWLANYVAFFYPEKVRTRWLQQFAGKLPPLPPPDTQPAWRVYHKLLHSGEFLEEVTTEEHGPLSVPFTETERQARPAILPDTKKVGVYRLKPAD